MATQSKMQLPSRRSLLTSLLPMLALSTSIGSVFAGYFLDPGVPQYIVEKITWAGAPSHVVAYALNNKGQVVVSSENPLDLLIWTSGRVQEIDLSEVDKKINQGRSSDRYGIGIHSITDEGLIVGVYRNQRGEYGSFTYKDGKFNPGQPPWATTNFGVWSANDRGDAIGSYDPRDQSGQGTAFVYLDGKLKIIKDVGHLLLNDVGQVLDAYRLQLTDLSGVTHIPKPSEGKIINRVIGMNNLGQFVGSMGVSPTIKGASFVAFVANKNGQFDLLDVGGSESSANDINDDEVVVGHRSRKFLGGAFSMGYGSKDPYVWIKGKAYDLGKASGLNLTRSSGSMDDQYLKINNRGQILVSVRTGESYLLTPIVFEFTHPQRLRPKGRGIDPQ